MTERKIDFEQPLVNHFGKHFKVETKIDNQFQTGYVGSDGIVYGEDGYPLRSIRSEAFPINIRRIRNFPVFKNLYKSLHDDGFMEVILSGPNTYTQSQRVRIIFSEIPEVLMREDEPLMFDYVEMSAIGNVSEADSVIIPIHLHSPQARWEMTVRPNSNHTHPAVLHLEGVFAVDQEEQKKYLDLKNPCIHIYSVASMFERGE